MTIKRGNIYFANLNPTIGNEINKVRPVLILSNDINNVHSNIVTVIPITSSILKVRHFEVFIPAGEANLPKDSKAKCDQIRTIDKSRFINELGKLSANYMVDIELAVLRHLSIQ